MSDNTSRSPRTPQTAKPRLPKQKSINPVEAAIRSCFSTQVSSKHSEDYLKNLTTLAPKRWVVHFPLVLLPSGSFEASFWQAAGSLTQAQKEFFFETILVEIGKREGKGLLTHLAVNAGIPLNKNEDEQENILRTPSGLIMLHGNFGPSLLPGDIPTESDFGEAFWVSTKQNGITQIWAPRYTMFSRGNVKEKARLLDFHGPNAALSTRSRNTQDLRHEIAVDLYAGIGYFVFSYVKLGMGQVLGWELNPWSVEGLRRGALANGWSVKVIGSEDVMEFGNENIVICCESNDRASSRLRGLLRDLGKTSHVNCGLLPSSENSWMIATELVQEDGWLHLHENVGVKDIKARTRAIEDKVRQILQQSSGDGRDARAEHVELVKTFAPGVWHCVFDVFISRNALDSR